MYQKVDITFYDSYAFTGEPPNIKLTKEKFYWETIPLQLETCKLEKFGEEYRNIFKEKNIDHLHCVTALDHVLEGHLTYDVCSYYFVKFFPCINGINGRANCKPIEIVRKNLTQTFVTFKMEDVDLTPKLYNTPVELRGKEVSDNVGKSLFQDVRSFFQIINIETDEDILGFEALQEIKKEKYIKYDQSVILSSLKQDIFETGDSICDVTIALSEKELTQRRTYPKLIEVLGDVGDLMEVFFSFFRIISSFLTDTLYETSLVNHLFSFDLDKKVLLIKDKNKDSKKNLFKDDSPKIYSPINNPRKLSQQNFIVIDEITVHTNKINDEALSKSKMTNDNLLIAKAKKRKKKKNKLKSSLSPDAIKIDIIEKDNNINGLISKEQKENNHNENDCSPNIRINKTLDNNEKKGDIPTERANDNKNWKEIEKEIEKYQKGIINEINIIHFALIFAFYVLEKEKILKIL